MKGSVAIRIPIHITKEFTLREMLEYFVENQKWLIKNEKIQFLLNIIQDFIPEIIKAGGKGYLNINFNL